MSNDLFLVKEDKDYPKFSDAVQPLGKEFVDTEASGNREQTLIDKRMEQEQENTADHANKYGIHAKYDENVVSILVLRIRRI